MPESLDRQTLLALPLNDVPFVLLDIESTGLEAAAGDRICEIALAHWQNRQTVRRWETLVNPGRPISAAAQVVNQISEHELATAPTFSMIAPTLLQELEGAVIVGHNVPFDIQFLDHELGLTGKPPIPNIRLDTLKLARSFLAHERYNLSALSHALGFEKPQHRAMSDVIALTALFDHLLSQLATQGIVTLDDLVRAQRGLLPGAPEPEAPPLIAEALRNGAHLRIAYRTNGADPITREILPLEFQVVDGVARLLAYCYLRNSQRTFYLERIDEVVLVPSAGMTQP